MKLKHIKLLEVYGKGKMVQDGVKEMWPET